MLWTILNLFCVPPRGLRVPYRGWHRCAEQNGPSGLGVQEPHGTSYVTAQHHRSLQTPLHLSPGGRDGQRMPSTRWHRRCGRYGHRAGREVLEPLDQHHLLGARFGPRCLPRRPPGEGLDAAQLLFALG